MRAPGAKAQVPRATTAGFEKLECVHKDLTFMNVKIGEKTSPRRLHHPNRPVVRSAEIP